jgi:hypothetical protein
MNDDDLVGVLFGLGFLILATVVLVVVLIQVGAFSRARIARRDETRLQSLVDRYEQLASESTQHQGTASAELAVVRERLDAIEHMLREVG